MGKSYRPKQLCKIEQDRRNNPYRSLRTTEMQKHINHAKIDTLNYIYICFVMICKKKYNISMLFKHN